MFSVNQLQVNHEKISPVKSLTGFTLFIDPGFSHQDGIVQENFQLTLWKNGNHPSWIRYELVQLLELSHRKTLNQLSRIQWGLVRGKTMII